LMLSRWICCGATINNLSLQNCFCPFEVDGNLYVFHMYNVNIAAICVCNSKVINTQ
jgi:hypothetical protein